MANEEFQKLVLEKLVDLENGQKQLKQELKEDIAKVESKIDQIGAENQKDVLAMLQIINNKIDKHSEILKILSSRSIEQEADILVLKKAK